jgi:hypothetical protein
LSHTAADVVKVCRYAAGGRHRRRYRDCREAAGPVRRAARHRRWLFARGVVALLAEMAVAMVTTAMEQT